MNNLTRDGFISEIYRFFNGKVYPLAVCAAAFLASVLEIEIFVLGVMALAFFVCAAVSDDAKPLIVTFITFCLCISCKHSPSHTVSKVYGDGNTDYYFTEWRLPIAVITAVLIVSGAVLFFVKNKCFDGILRGGAFFWSTLAFSFALIMGGAFTSYYSDGLTLALGEACVFSLFYFLFAYGFRKGESIDALMGYFSYVSALVSGVIILQLSCLFLSSDIVFLNGSINKEGIMLGWGIWTLIGIHLAMLIPAIFYNAICRGRRGIIYFLVATLTLLFAFLSMSRGAQLISLSVYSVCLVVAAFKSEIKSFYRIVIGIFCALALLASLLFADELPRVIAVFFDDNGRAEHAENALANFLSSPLFGVGFSGFESIRPLPDEILPMGPLPAMAHCTPLQLLSATGAFGFLTYIFYRAASLIPVLKKRTLPAALSFLGAAVIFIGGLVDNFPFDIYPMFYSQIALAISHRASE